jgi:hypothetical protein
LQQGGGDVGAVAGVAPAKEAAAAVEIRRDPDMLDPDAIEAARAAMPFSVRPMARMAASIAVARAKAAASVSALRGPCGT